MQSKPSSEEPSRRIEFGSAAARGGFKVSAQSPGLGQNGARNAALKRKDDVRLVRRRASGIRRTRCAGNERGNPCAGGSWEEV